MGNGFERVNETEREGGQLGEVWCRYAKAWVRKGKRENERKKEREREREKEEN